MTDLLAPAVLFEAHVALHADGRCVLVPLKWDTYAPAEVARVRDALIQVITDWATQYGAPDAPRRPDPHSRPETGQSLVCP